MYWHTPNAHCRLRVGEHERLYLCSYWTEFHNFFVQRGKNHFRQRLLDFVSSFIVSKHIRAQT